MFCILKMLKQVWSVSNNIQQIHLIQYLKKMVLIQITTYVLYSENIKTSLKCFKQYSANTFDTIFEKNGTNTDNNICFVFWKY